MSDEEIETVTYVDMLDMIDNAVGLEITNVLVKTKSPIHAMCTLAACMASVITSFMNEEDKAHHNVDEFSELTKNLISEVLKKDKEDGEFHTESSIIH